MRWYSPRDYVEEEVCDDAGGTVVQGSLSARMKIPGNMWVEAWESAKATPARRQRRLFDDTKEAERVRFMHHFSSAARSRCVETSLVASFWTDSRMTDKQGTEELVSCSMPCVSSYYR